MRNHKHRVFKKGRHWYAFCPYFGSYFGSWEWRQAMEHANYCTCFPRRFHNFLMGRGRWR